LAFLVAAYRLTGWSTLWCTENGICGVAAVDARARRVDQVLHLRVAAALQDVGEADDVAVDVGVRVLSE
jgi:hypothetical protein